MYLRCNHPRHIGKGNGGVFNEPMRTLPYQARVINKECLYVGCQPMIGKDPNERLAGQTAPNLGIRR